MAERLARDRRGLADERDAEGVSPPAPRDASFISSGLACLMLIARGAGLSVDGLRIVGDAGPKGLEPDMAVLATSAVTAGFRAQAVTLDWRHLQDLGRAVPAIIAFRDGRRLVLTRIAQRGETPDVTLVDPADPHHPFTLLRAAFELAWTGEAVLLKRQSALVGKERPLGWSALVAAARQQPRMLRDAGLATLVLAGLAVVPVLGARALVGDVMVSDAWETLAFVLIGLVALVAFEMAFAVLRGRLVAGLAAACDRALTETVLGRALALPAPALAKGDAERRIGRLAAITAFLSGSLPRIVVDAGIGVLLLPVLVWLDAPLSGLVLAIALVAIGLIVLLSGRQARATAAVRAATDDAALVMRETTAHRASIQALGLWKRQRRAWDVTVARITRGRLANAAAAGTLDGVAACAEAAIRYAPVVLGIALDLGGAHRPGLMADLFAFALGAWRFAAPLRDLGPGLRDWGAAKAAMTEAASWADTHNLLPESDLEGVSTAAFAGHVGFKDVAFTYPDAPDPTLRSVSFTIASGTMVGLVGRSGAGKSTLARLLGRQLPEVEGLIKIDGIDVRAIPADQLRRTVAVVQDDAAWFAGTLGNNLVAVAPDATDAAVWDVLRLTGADAAVDALPDGLATRIEAGALSLSDGERQRLAIARALMGCPAVLVLDDATPALDAAAEARLLSDLKQAGRLTVLAITQRLTSLAQADAIVVLDGGEVQDIGHHRDLILRSDFYNGLWQRHEPRLAAPIGADALPSPSTKAA